MDGQIHHFSAGGLYDGLVLLIDDETKSYWDHITGECVHGELAGRRMENWGIAMTTVAAAMKTEAGLPVFVSRPPLLARFLAWGQRMLGDRLPSGFHKTMGRKDERLPAMEMGLGVVTETTQRFYRMTEIRQTIDDMLDGRELHVSLGEDGVPAACWSDASRPLQLFSRWYGFSYTYPQCEIYEPKR